MTLGNYKKHFDSKLLNKLDKYITDKDISEIQLFGGEPGMLSRTELQQVFDKINEFKHIEKICIYTNGMFYRRYSLDMFNINSNIRILSIIHITKKLDITNLYVSNVRDSKFLVVMNSIEDVYLVCNLILEYPKYKISCVFPDNFSENFITYELYTTWIKCKNILQYMYNVDEHINKMIFDKLTLSEISYTKFKSLLLVNKGIVNAVNAQYRENKIYEYMY